MPDSNAGQRKMMRGMSPGGGSPFHDSMPAGGTHTTRASQKLDRQAYDVIILGDVSARRLGADRVAKKQIKTREERAARREQS